MSESKVQTVALTVNGKAVQVTADPDGKLLHFLREQLGLTSVHLGCGANQCGACHVIVDGHPIAACDTPMWAVAGKSVTTLEGLGTPEAPHALQKALIAEQAMQCGYCISGIMTTAAALLASKKNPSEADVRAALDRNLCRCGAHNRIVRAVLSAAQEMASA